LSVLVDGADDGSRTHTPFRGADFKSAASTVSPRPPLLPKPSSSSGCSGPAPRTIVGLRRVCHRIANETRRSAGCRAPNGNCHSAIDCDRRSSRLTRRLYGLQWCVACRSRPASRAPAGYRPLCVEARIKLVPRPVFRRPRAPLPSVQSQSWREDIWRETGRSPPPRAPAPSHSSGRPHRLCAGGG
jgi:hypothetical protein